MAKIPKGLAQRIVQLIKGEVLPASQLKYPVITQMLDNGILQRQVRGRSRSYIFCHSANVLQNFVSNEYGINDMQLFIDSFDSSLKRADNIIASSDSKSTRVRTFKGFLVNCITPVDTLLNEEDFEIIPTEGAFTYIYDFETFKIPEDTLVVGVENAENFRYIVKQANLFATQSILFVSRYPQSNDLINWLRNIPNRYLHYGDFDFEGIRIYRDEYLKHLGDRADFYIPDNIEALLDKYGNKELYDKQYKFTLSESLKLTQKIESLINSFHIYKKCVEQEVMVNI